MKRSLSFMKLMLVMLFAFIGISGWAQSTSTLTFTEACGGSGTADDGAIWTVSSDGAESVFDGAKGIHYGTGSAAVKYITLSTSGITGTITSIVVNASTANGVEGSVSVTVGGADFGTQGQALTTNAADYTFTGSATGEIVVTVEKPSAAVKALYVKSIAVTYTVPEPPVTGPIQNADFASMTGWTPVLSGEYRDCGNGLIGDYKVYGDNAATVDGTHLATEYCVGFECRWATNYAAYTQETAELEPGVYTLQYDVENVNGSTTSASYENRFTVTVGGKTYTDGKTEWMKGGSAWTTHTITFKVTEASTAVISLGYGTGSNNIDAAKTPVLYVSHLSLAPVENAGWVDPGYYTLYNVGAGKYLNKGNGWGTQASIAEGTNAMAVELVPDANNQYNLYQIRTGINGNNNGVEVLSGGTVYTDQSKNKLSTWRFIPVDADNHIYNIVSVDNHGGGAGMYMAANAENTIVDPVADGASTYAQWKLVNLDDHSELITAMDEASADAPVDVTELITDANFSFPAIKQDAWTVNANNCTLFGGAPSNPCAESWQSAFTLSQTLTVPNGTYELTAQAALTDYTNAYDGVDYPVVYANDATTPFIAMEDADRESSMTQLSGSFTAGKYTTQPLTVKVENGQLTVGVRGTRTNTWCIWDNFQLKYYGWTYIVSSDPELQHATVTANPAIQKPGEDVKLTVTPDAHYVVSKVTVKCGENSQEVDLETLTFTMPEGDVVVYVETLPLYAVNIDAEIQNATAEADVVEQLAGEKVQLTVTPAEGYVIEDVTVTYGTENTEVVVAEDYSFTMPAAPVTVSVKSLEFATLIADSRKAWRDYNLEINKWDSELAPKDEAGNAILPSYIATSKMGEKTVQQLMDQANLEIDQILDGGATENSIKELAAILEGVKAVRDFAKAQYDIFKVIPVGKYYIQENATGKFFAPGNDWGTRASLMDHSVEWTLDIEDGFYTLESVVSNGDDKGEKQYYFGGSYCDSKKTFVTIKNVAEGLYTMETAAGTVSVKEGKFLEANAEEAAQFKIVAADASKAQKGDDITYVIKDADFGRNNRWGKDGENNDKGNAWTVVANNCNISGGKNDNRCAESWKSAFTVSQEVAVPNGYYTLTVQAGVNEYEKTGKDLPVVFANEFTSVFKAITGGEDNMDKMSDSFSAGKYVVSVPVLVEDGKLTVGVKGTRTDTWCIWDNFGLVYEGTEPTDDYLYYINGAPYAELQEAFAAAEKAYADAKAIVDGYDEFVKKAVAEDEKLIADSLKHENDTEDVLGTDGKPTGEKKDITDYLYPRIEKANADHKCGEKKEEFLAEIAKIQDAIKAYAEKAKTLQENNDNAKDELEKAMNDLLAEWQAAYDKINTEYKEWIKDNKDYQGYLTTLNSSLVAIDGLSETINLSVKAGTAAERKEGFLASIKEESNHISSLVARALNTYNDDVLTKNVAALGELSELTEAKLKLYSAAVNKVSDHYATWHANAADEAQTALFAVFKAIQDIKDAYTKAYDALDKENKTKFEADPKDLPLGLFDNATYKTQLNAISADQIDDILADVEAAAAKDNNFADEDEPGMYQKFTAKVTVLNDAKDNLKFYGLDADKYKEDTDNIAALIKKLSDEVEAYKVHGWHEAVEAKPATDTEPAVEAQPAYWSCLLEAKAAFDADYEAADAAIKALQAKLDDDKNAALLEEILAATKAVSDKLTAAWDVISKYEDATIAEGLSVDKAAIEATIAEVETQAKALDEAGELIKMSATLLAKIGDATDTSLPLPAATATVDEEKSVKYSAAVVNETVGDAEAAEYVAYKIGTKNDKGKLLLNIPAEATGFTFTGATWYDIASDKLIVKQGDVAVELKESDAINANAGITGNSPFTVITAAATYTVDFEAALVEETAFSFELETANRFVIWNLQLKGVSAKEPSISQAINKLAHDGSNENLNNVLTDAIATLNKNLTDAKTVAAELNDAIDADNQIKKDIEKLDKDVKADYEAVALPEAAYDVTVTTIQKKIDDALTVVYKKDLEAKMLDLKKDFNAAYADPDHAIDTEISKDDLWAQIQNEQLAVDALVDVDGKTYAEHCAIIANIGLQFTDYAQWIENNIKPGDINLDKEVTITDVVKLVNILVNKAVIDVETGEEEDIDIEASGLRKDEFWAADVNGDKKLDGADLALVIDLMLGKEIVKDETAAGVRAEDATDYLVLNGADLALVNTREYVNFTLIVKAADGVQPKFQTVDRTAGMQIATTKQGNFYKVLVYSADNTAISGNEGSILTLGGEGLTITSAKFVAAGQTYSLGVDDVTAIRDINADLQGADIYTISGAKANRLQKGVNVIRMADGTVKKVLVK